jgi:hypothetical protein
MTQLGETVAIGLIGPGSDLDKFKTWETWDFDEAFQFVDWAGDPIGNVRYEILMSGCSHQYGVTDDQGRIPRLKGYHPLGLKVRFLGITKPPGSARPIPETDSKRVCLAIPDIEGTPIFRCR